jgi:2,3-dihydroxybiphenyl 1,2-dioxygenase
MASVSALGYIGCSATRLDETDEVLRAVFSLQRRPDSPEGVNQYRIDEQHHRIALRHGSRDGLDFIGWEVDQQGDLDEIAKQVEKSGTKVTRGNPKLCAERAVMDLIWFKGPDGVRTEVFFAPVQDFAPFTPERGISGFNTGTLGLGHLVIASKDPNATVEWYRKVLGFKLSDYIFWDDVEATFLHCNPRHHSIAFTNLCGPFKPGQLNHFMLEANSLDDVGRAYDIVNARGIELALTLGRHTNDFMTSFYVAVPGGWWIEYGWGARLIDDAVWEPRFYNSPKIWGHERPGAD